MGPIFPTDPGLMPSLYTDGAEGNVLRHKASADNAAISNSSDQHITVAVRRIIVFRDKLTSQAIISRSAVRE